MRRLVVVSFMSLDGFYEGPGKDVTALPMDETFGQYNLERIRSADTVLLGARSYRGFRSYWPPKAEDRSAASYEREFARIYNRILKVVVSDHASPPPAGHPWSGSTRIVKRRAARAEIDILKRGKGRDVVMWGSRTLWNDLIGHGLVDELHLIVGAATLGAGTRTFKNYPASLRRLEVRPFKASQSVLLRYQVLNAPR